MHYLDKILYQIQKLKQQNNKMQVNKKEEENTQKSETHVVWQCIFLMHVLSTELNLILFQSFASNFTA